MTPPTAIYVRLAYAQASLQPRRRRCKLPSDVAQRVSGAKQFSVHQIKGLRVAYLCRIARHEAQSVPSIIKGSRETARTASTQAGALSSLLMRAWLPAASGPLCTSYTVPGHDRCDTRRPAAAARPS